MNTAYIHLKAETGEEGLDWEASGERLYRKCIERLSGLPWLAKQLRFTNSPVRHWFYRCPCRNKEQQHNLSQSSKSESYSYLNVTEFVTNHSCHKSCVSTVKRTGGDPPMSSAWTVLWYVFQRLRSFMSRQHYWKVAVAQETWPARVWGGIKPLNKAVRPQAPLSPRPLGMGFCFFVSSLNDTLACHQGVSWS